MSKYKIKTMLLSILLLFLVSTTACSFLQGATGKTGKDAWSIGETVLLNDSLPFRITKFETFTAGDGESAIKTVFDWKNTSDFVFFAMPGVSIEATQAGQRLTDVFVNSKDFNRESYALKLLPGYVQKGVEMAWYMIDSSPIDFTVRQFAQGGDKFLSFTIDPTSMTILDANVPRGVSVAADKDLFVVDPKSAEVMQPTNLHMADTFTLPPREYTPIKYSVIQIAEKQKPALLLEYGYKNIGTEVIHGNAGFIATVYQNGLELESVDAIETHNTEVALIIEPQAHVEVYKIAYYLQDLTSPVYIEISNLDKPEASGKDAVIPDYFVHLDLPTMAVK